MISSQDDETVDPKIYVAVKKALNDHEHQRIFQQEKHEDRRRFMNFLKDVSWMLVGVVLGWIITSLPVPHEIVEFIRMLFHA